MRGRIVTTARAHQVNVIAARAPLTHDEAGRHARPVQTVCFRMRTAQITGCASVGDCAMRGFLALSDTRSGDVNQSCADRAEL
jgi:hypothetical protein